MAIDPPSAVGGDDRGARQFAAPMMLAPTPAVFTFAPD
jgi:hypothetical protein